MRSMMLGLLGGAVLAGPALAQDTTAVPTVQEAIRGAQPTQYTVPVCDLGGGHFKISSGRSYVKSALESPDNRARIMGQAHRVLVEAITVDGQADKAEAWFWLGRVYLYEGDLVGADSALTRAKQLAPGCASEIDSFRRPTWAALTNPGLNYMNDGNTALAKEYLTTAAGFYDGEPQAFTGLGIMAANEGNTPEATAWFEKAVAAASDTSQAEAKSQALFNLGLMYQRGGRNEDAARVLGEYVAMRPDDADGRKALMQSLQAAGMTDSARVLERQMAEQLTNVGSDAAVPELMAAGVTYFNDGNYAQASEMFERALAAEPYNRDAAFNLANAELGAGDADGLVVAGTRLAAIEPMNESAQKLKAQGYQMKGTSDSVLVLLEAIEAMPVSVQVSSFNTGASEATWTATATGREPKDISGNAIPSREVTLLVEFLDAAGTVVSADRVTIPVIPPGETRELAVSGAGSGIRAWRYRAE